MKEVATDYDDDDDDADDDDKSSCDSLFKTKMPILFLWVFMFSGDLPIQVQKESYSHLWASEISFDH